MWFRCFLTGVDLKSFYSAILSLSLYKLLYKHYRTVYIFVIPFLVQQYGLFFWDVSVWQISRTSFKVLQDFSRWGFLVAQTVKRLSAMQETRVQSLGWEDPLEKEMATHSSTLAWKIPWTEEPDRLQSTGSQRVRHDWTTLLTYLGLPWWSSG